jgi:hypothetical protein
MTSTEWMDERPPGEPLGPIYKYKLEINNTGHRPVANVADNNLITASFMPSILPGTFRYELLLEFYHDGDTQIVPHLEFDDIILATFINYGGSIEEREMLLTQSEINRQEFDPPKTWRIKYWFIDAEAMRNYRAAHSS